MKNSNIHKTIPFQDKKNELDKSRKSRKLRLQKILDNSHKIIPYPKTKRSNNFNFFKKNKPLAIILALLVFLIILSLFESILFKDNSIKSTDPSSTEFTSEDITVSAFDFSNHSSTIERCLRNTLNLGTSSEVLTDTMHKNGDSIYAHGYFSLPAQGNIYFDIILKNRQPYSLVINGAEYIKSSK